jgi:hypothetical protein
VPDLLERRIEEVLDSDPRHDDPDVVKVVVA